MEQGNMQWRLKWSQLLLIQIQPVFMQKKTIFKTNNPSLKKRLFLVISMHNHSDPMKGNKGTQHTIFSLEYFLGIEVDHCIAAQENTGKPGNGKTPYPKNIIKFDDPIFCDA